MRDISHPTGTRPRPALAVVGSAIGAVAVAASAFAYTAITASDDAPFLAAGVQAARREATAESALPPAAAPTPSPAEPEAPAAIATPAIEDTPEPAPPAVESASSIDEPPPTRSISIAAAPPSAGVPMRAVSVPPPPAPPAAAPVAASAPPPPPVAAPAVASPPPPPPAAAPIVAPAPPPPASGALNAREQGLVDAMNSRRAAAGLGPLTVSSALTGVARTRSSDMLTNDYFAHTGPSGQTWYGLLSSLGLSYSAGGENLAKVSGSAATTVATAIEALMASPTHRANILNAAYRLVGVGAASQGDTVTILTSIFTDR